jgi:gliding motility-associated-like protein
MTYQNQIADYDTVWVRVQNSNGCHRVAQIDLDVVPSSAVVNGFLNHFYQCDDGVDTRDGIATFDFSSTTVAIQNLFAPLTIDVLYYETEDEANQGLVADQLDSSNYNNTSQDQLIWVQIVSDSGSDCLAKGQYVQLHVESLPVANAPTTIMKQCDDDQDGFFPFDTSTITGEILNGQNLADVTITYFNEDGSLISGVVNSALPNPFATNSQTIDIVVTNNATNDPDGACNEATTLTFIVDILPINEVQPIAAVCEDDPDDGMLIATFDTSNLEASINAQVGMDITYLDATGNTLKDIDGNVIVSPFPNSFVTQTQTITIVVVNPQNTSCPQSKTVDFIVNPRPVFDVIKEDFVCQNLLPKSISIENSQGNYTYQWFNSLGDLLMSGATLSLDETNSVDITISGVQYSVIATDIATNCTGFRKFLLKKSSIATLLDENVVTIEFNSPDNSIRIDTSNLGDGVYEFALEHDSDSRSFQDDPVFTNLLGGVYTLLINDENGCGEISKQIFLLDYPKFFTPNNDGQNDVWSLTGVDSSNFTASPIQIYDRFGKVVATINPIQGQGWDGLYNNEM